MKLSDYKDEAALDLLADLIEPASKILSDEDVRKEVEDGNPVKAVSIAIKNHKKDVIAVLAAIDGVPVEEYHCSFLTLPLRLVELFNDPDIGRLFTSAGQTEEETVSGSHTENTKVAEQ